MLLGDMRCSVIYHVITFPFETKTDIDRVYERNKDK
jgi:hypothetical protein